MCKGMKDDSKSRGLHGWKMGLGSGGRGERTLERESEP